MKTENPNTVDVNTEYELIKNPKDDLAIVNPGQLGALKYERALCLDKHKTSKLGGDAEVLLCDDYVKINEKELDSANYISITMEALSELYKNSSGLRSHSSDVLALKIILGADSSTDTMHFFYQPVSLSLISEIVDAELQNQGIFDIAKPSPIYSYTGSEFQTTSIGDQPDYYRDHVLIFHNDVDKWGIFSPEKDVEAVIFSFQEIFNFIYTNKLPGLRLYNCIRRFNTLGKGVINKHSLILAEDGPYGPIPHKASPKAMAKELEIFRGAYSNLTHLCPPNCARLMHPLERLDF